MFACSDSTSCRVCGSPGARLVGHVEYYAGFEWPVSDCAACGCRFTRHDESVYDQLHAEANSSYNRYRELAARCKALFNKHDLVGLERELCETPKYKFVIQQTKALGPGLRILEIGCARGFLTSWFILAGYAITGVDVSLEAIASARAAFGDHFALAGSSLVEERAPYDAIYHVGTIGCVADPLGMTRRLLSLLKPGGRLLFNAPNRAALWYRDELWFDSAPPPDVVTLFPPGFWRKQFGDLADVREETELHDADRNLLIGLRQLFGRGWRKPVPLPMSESYKAFRPTPQAGDGLWSLFARCVGKAGRVTKLSRLAPAQQTEYGFFVSMRRNA